MKTAFFDIDTQLDFMLPSGALYVPGSERLIPAIARLNAHAAARGLPLVSSTDAHTEDDPEFRQWPSHCVAGTTGQKKIAATQLDRYVIIPPQPVAVGLESAPQIIVQKVQLDLFSNPNLPALLQQLAADAYAVYGVVTEYCVGCAARGLLDTGKPVWIVSDAIQTLNAGDSDRTLRDLAARGAKLTTVSEICSR